MKQFSILLLCIMTLLLSSCFTKNQDATQDAPTPEVETQDQLEQEIQIDATQSGVQLESDLDTSTSEGETETQSPQQSDTWSTQSEVSTDISASWSVDAIQSEELKEYEADLEDLFKDILWEIDDGPKSE